jgi:RHS repeat-associated protein
MFRLKTSRRQPSIPLRIVALFLIPIQACFVAPPNVLAAAAATSESPAVSKKAALTVDPTKGIKVNRTLPKVETPKALTFSKEPKDSEFTTISVFSEPLVPVGGKTTPAENNALAKAITAFSNTANPEYIKPFTTFLEKFPSSPWRASLLANLGATYRSTGYWSKALAAWEESWKVLAKETEPKAKALGDFVLGSLAQMNARLGRYDRLEALFAEIGDRDVRGPATEKLAGARQGLALMSERPQDAFRCGPMALQRILVAQGKGAQPVLNKQILESRSTRSGISLTEVKKLSDGLGMHYQMAKRSAGAPVIYPSVVNWKVGHFAALVKESNGKFLSQDPTFTDDVWVTHDALDQEGSGYYLIPEGKLPQGWEPVNESLGNTIWGKGSAGTNTPPAPPCVAPSIKCSDCSGTSDAGMADYNVDAARVSLSISDTPVGYAPPKGLAVRFTASYQQREVAPVSIPTYSNLGNKWSFNWISYIVVDPANVAANATAYGPGGGTLDYTGFNTSTQSYAPQFETHALMVKTGTNRYEKQFADGSKQIFSLSDGASVYPRKIFMTQWIDPQGNSLTYTYDGTFRLAAVSDALGQVTTLSYQLASDPLKITKVSDPFGRSATFQYNPDGQLWKITDSVGLVSEFIYDTGDFINKMTTPYGDTNFQTIEYGSGYRRLIITDPQGGREWIEYDSTEWSTPDNDPANTIPTGCHAVNGYNSHRNTFYWDKKAMAEAPGDYTKARVTHWLHTADMNSASDVAESAKEPLENRVWYDYPGGGWIALGNTNQASAVGRVLDDGTTQLYQNEHNSFGKTTKVTDPAGRVTAYVYDTNGIDLLEVRQQTGGINELLASYTYNTQHLPLTATDASGKTTTYTYNSTGQVRTITNAKNEVTTYNYDANGYLQNIVGAVPGAITSLTYDGFGRLRTTTDSEGYTVTVDYDAIGGDPTKTLNRFAKVTYPDGTYEQTTYDRLDPEWTRDRIGRWSRKFYDALRHVVATQDPLNRIVLYDWCNCGSLEAITDQNGNETRWTRDIQGRVTDKTYADATKTHYTYEATTSRLAVMTDAKMQSTNYQYFIDNNLKQVSYTNAQIATPTVSYTYDTNYNRLVTMTDDTGVTTYAYNPIAVPPAIGAGRLASTDGPLMNDTITYGYDELGRVTNRSIDGAANAASVEYDSLGRVQNVTNVLGSFAYAYVNTTGRVDHVDLPNGQKTNYTYFDNLGDQRLKQIKNLDPTSAVISQFDYTYNATGDILTWTQANSGQANPRRYDFGYDPADHLRSALLTDTVTGASVNQYAYDYDPAGNRINAQLGSAVISSVANNLNQITSQSAGGKMHFHGAVNEPATVTIGGNAATVDGQSNFDGTANVNVGANTVPVVATDASGNSRTNNYQINVPLGVNTNSIYDLNGNLTSDGSKTYEWDAEDRLVAINYVEQPYRTEMIYDGLSRRVAIIEKDNGTVTSTKRFVWSGTDISEERDGNNMVTRRFLGVGEQITGASYYYNRDHLGSIRELTDSTALVHVRYEYDPYGMRTKVGGELDAAFGFTGHYLHASGLSLTLYRAYDTHTGRWLSRDPKGEDARLNLYDYVNNRPTVDIDPLGLEPPNFIPPGNQAPAYHPSTPQRLPDTAEPSYNPQGIPKGLPLGPAGISKQLVVWGAERLMNLAKETIIQDGLRNCEKTPRSPLGGKCCKCCVISLYGVPWLGTGYVIWHGGGAGVINAPCDQVKGWGSITPLYSKNQIDDSRYIPW